MLSILLVLQMLLFVGLKKKDQHIFFSLCLSWLERGEAM